MANVNGERTSSAIMIQLEGDNKYFKNLLDLVCPATYFSSEQKEEIWGKPQDDVEKQSIKRKNGNLLASLSVTQITELQQERATLENKHNGKKQSRNAKANKHKAKEIQKREARLEELKERLSKKLEEIKARKSAGNVVSSQEEKKLKRQEKRVNAKLKGKNKNNINKEQHLMQASDGLRSPPQHKILNHIGQPVKSKFDFSLISTGDDKSRTSDFRGRDYARLLEKVMKRKEKVEKLKEKDLEAGKQLEEKLLWQAVLGKAKGEKVKDDPNLLKKAAKRKEKIKEKKQKKWDDRIKTVTEVKKKKQDKRQANIDKRKDTKKDKKRKKMIKKGRIIPGF